MNPKRNSAPWPVVAFGMIGASISGVTFVSVPGNVWAQNFFYIPLVLGFCAGYAVVAEVLMPLYWRRNIVSIYEYVGERFGAVSQKTAGAAFILARISSVAVRLYAAILVLSTFLPMSWHSLVPSWISVAVLAILLLLLILPYAYRGGVRALVWTDVIQTAFMLGTVVLTICCISRSVSMPLSSALRDAAAIRTGDCDVPVWSMFDFRAGSPTNALKQFISGIFITIAMTGLDQSMIQKSLSCRDLKASKKNMYMTALNILLVNVFFLCFGMLLCWYVQRGGGMEAFGIGRTDEIFPAVARSLGPFVSFCFVMGLVCATLPSAGNAIVAMTTSVCRDFLGNDRVRGAVMLSFSAVFIAVAVALEVLSNDAVINVIYKLVSYTDGPLLGIFAFGILTRRKAVDRAVPWIAAASPLLCLAVNHLLTRCAGFDLGFTLLIVNSAITFIFLYLSSLRRS